MRSAILVSIILSLSLVVLDTTPLHAAAPNAAPISPPPAQSQQSTPDQLTGNPADNPGAFSFKQFYKCHGEAKSLGDTGGVAACLTACGQRPEAKGCWWLDGSGGFDRECRICLDGPPGRDIFSNDWGIPITH